MGFVLGASGIAFGKCHNIAKGGLLRCFVKILHAKVIRVLIVSLGGVLVLVQGG